MWSRLWLKRTFCVILCCCLQPPIFADHFPPSDIAIGNAEHRLGGISIHDDTVAAVIMRLGPPNKFEESTSRDYPAGSGERSYEWNRDGIRLRMGTEFYTDKKAMTLVESAPIFVDIWGQHGGGKLGITGSGLSIGDDLAKVRKLYGDRFQTDPHSVTIQWKDETTLSIDFSDDGVPRQNAIRAQKRLVPELGDCFGRDIRLGKGCLLTAWRREGFGSQVTRDRRHTSPVGYSQFS